MGIKFLSKEKAEMYDTLFDTSRTLYLLEYMQKEFKNFCFVPFLK